MAGCELKRLMGPYAPMVIGPDAAGTSGHGNFQGSVHWGRTAPDGLARLAQRARRNCTEPTSNAIPPEETIMKHASFILPAALGTILAITGCNDGARSDYPDRSQETRARTDSIRQDADRRNAAIDRELEERKTALGFQAKQVSDKAKVEREQIALEADQTIAPLKARRDEAAAAAKRERERIETEGDAKLATVSGDEATKIKADVETRKAEAARKAAETAAETGAAIDREKSNAAAKVAKIDEREAKELAEISRQRSEAERQARERKLAVSVETTNKLDEVGEESAERMEKRRKELAAASDKDREINDAVRKDIDRRGDSVKGVTVATSGGVVTLSGAVPNETVRRELVSDVSKVNGVVRVDDRLAVR
jgi:hypothetical protein